MRWIDSPGGVREVRRKLQTGYDEWTRRWEQRRVGGRMKTDDGGAGLARGAVAHTDVDALRSVATAGGAVAANNPVALATPLEVASAKTMGPEDASIKKSVDRAGLLSSSNGVGGLAATPAAGAAAITRRILPCFVIAIDTEWGSQATERDKQLVAPMLSPPAVLQIGWLGCPVVWVIDMNREGGGDDEDGNGVPDSKLSTTMTEEIQHLIFSMFSKERAKETVVLAFGCMADLRRLHAFAPRTCTVINP